DFGKGFVAKSHVGLWRTRGEHQPIVGEYSFQVKFDRREDVPRKVDSLVKQFFVELQHDVSDWVALGTTKTGLVYRLKKNATESDEWGVVREGGARPGRRRRWAIPNRHWPHLPGFPPHWRHELRRRCRRLPAEQPRRQTPLGERRNVRRVAGDQSDTA